MATALKIDSAIPGRLAANAAPRLAAMLMSAANQGAPLKVTAHAANAGTGLAAIFSPGDPLSRWVASVTAPKEEERVVLMKQDTTIDEARVPLVTEAVRPVSPIASIYRRLLGESGPISRQRSADELLEAARPAPAGVTAVAARHDVDAQVDRKTELVRIAAMVAAVGFGRPASAVMADGDFEATVLRNVELAAGVIAPGLPLTGLAPVQLQAVVTASMHSSNSSFLEGMGASSAGAVPRQVSDLLRAVPDGGKVAVQFMEQGTFSPDKFLEAAAGVGLHASEVAGATPTGIKLALISAAAQKALFIVQQVRRGVRDHETEGRMQLGLGKSKRQNGPRQAQAEDDTMQFEDMPKPSGV
jgi:hypothetical protein